MSKNPIITSLVVEGYDFGAKTGLSARYSDGSHKGIRLDDRLPKDVLDALKDALETARTADDVEMESMMGEDA